MIDRMMAEPAKPKAPEPERNPHAGAAAASTPPPMSFGPKAVVVERNTAPKTALDEAAELFRTIFKGDIVP